MGKITISNNENGYCLVNKLIENEAVNERVLATVSSGKVKNLLPVSVNKKRNEIELCCKALGLVSLDSYLGMNTTKTPFLQIVRNIVDIAIECEKHKINIINLDLSADRVFLDAKTKEVWCVYWPIVNNTDEKQLAQFFRTLPEITSFAKESNDKYRVEYNKFFGNGMQFSLSNFDRLITELMTVEKPHYKQEQQVYKRDYSEADIIYDPIKALEEKYRSKPLEHKTPHGGKCIESGTTILGEVTHSQPLSENPPRGIAYITRIKTHERVLIKDSGLTIGTNPEYCDYVVNNNRAVSGKHARIEWQGGSCVISDLGSTNKTKIGEQIIPPGTKFSLSNGLKFVLANELFEFSIENNT